MNTPTIRRAIAPSARMISGRIGRRSVKLVRLEVIVFPYP